MSVFRNPPRDRNLKIKLRYTSNDRLISMRSNKKKESRPKEGVLVGEYFSLMVTLRLLFRRNSKFERLKTSVAGSDMSSDVPSRIYREQVMKYSEYKTRTETAPQLELAFFTNS